MVLFVDSNKFRREKLARMCRTEDLPAMSIGFEDYKYYTKPLVTVLVDPPKSFTATLNRNERTLFIVVIKREEQRKYYSDMCTVTDDSGMIYPEKITEIIKERTEFNLVKDIFTYLYMNMEEKEPILDGKVLFLTKTQFKILRFFFYNNQRTFRYDELFEYFHYNGRIKYKTFDGHVQSINRHSRYRHREQLIFKRRTGYEMPELTGFNPYAHDQRFNVLQI